MVSFPAFHCYSLVLSAASSLLVVRGPAANHYASVSTRNEPVKGRSGLALKDRRFMGVTWCACSQQFEARIWTRYTHHASNVTTSMAVHQKDSGARRKLEGSHVQQYQIPAHVSIAALQKYCELGTSSHVHNVKAGIPVCYPTHG